MQIGIYIEIITFDIDSTINAGDDIQVISTINVVGLNQEDLNLSLVKMVDGINYIHVADMNYHKESGKWVGYISSIILEYGTDITFQLKITTPYPEFDINSNDQRVGVIDTAAPDLVIESEPTEILEITKNAYFQVLAIDAASQVDSDEAWLYYKVNPSTTWERKQLDLFQGVFSATLFTSEWAINGSLVQFYISVQDFAGNFANTTVNNFKVQDYTSPQIISATQIPGSANFSTYKLSLEIFDPSGIDAVLISYRTGKDTLWSNQSFILTNNLGVSKVISGVTGILYTLSMPVSDVENVEFYIIVIDEYDNFAFWSTNGKVLIQAQAQAKPYSIINTNFGIQQQINISSNTTSTIPAPVNEPGLEESGLEESGLDQLLQFHGVNILVGLVLVFGLLFGFARLRSKDDTKKGRSESGPYDQQIEDIRQQTQNRSATNTTPDITRTHSTSTGNRIQPIKARSASSMSETQSNPTPEIRYSIQATEEPENYSPPNMQDINLVPILTQSNRSITEANSRLDN